MVEQRSSTPYVWVRSPLSLKIFHPRKNKKHNLLTFKTHLPKLSKHVYYPQTPLCLTQKYNKNNQTTQDSTLFNTKQTLNYFNNKNPNTCTWPKLKYNHNTTARYRNTKQKINSILRTNIHHNKYTQSVKLAKNSLLNDTNKTNYNFNTIIPLRKIKLIRSAATTQKLPQNNQNNSVIVFKKQKITNVITTTNYGSLVFNKHNSQITCYLVAAALTNDNNNTLKYLPNKLVRLTNLSCLSTANIIRVLRNSTTPQTNDLIHTNMYNPKLINLRIKAYLKTPSQQHLHNNNHLLLPVVVPYNPITIKPLNQINDTLKTISLWLYSYAKQRHYSNTSLIKTINSNYFNQYVSIFLTNSPSLKSKNFYYEYASSLSTPKHLKQLTLIKSIFFLKASNNTPTIFNKLATKKKSPLLQKSQTGLSFYENYANTKYFFKNKPVYDYVSQIRALYNQNMFYKKKKMPSITKILSIRRLLYNVSLTSGTKKTVYKNLNIVNIDDKITKNSLYYKHTYLSQKPLLKFTKRSEKPKIFKKTLLWEKLNKLNTPFNKKTGNFLNTSRYKYKSILFNKTLDTKIFFVTTRFASFFKNTAPLYLKKLLKNINSLGGVNYLNYKTINKNFLLDNVLRKKQPPQYYPLDNVNTQVKSTLYKTTNYLKIHKIITNHPVINLTLLQNPFIFKLNIIKITCKSQLLFNLPLRSATKPNNLTFSNVLPSNNFSYIFLKKVYSSLSHNKINVNFIPVYYSTLVRFMENISGNKVLIQFYPFVNQSITQDFVIKYKLWLPRLTFYEKRLGHKFFLEESLHILHLSFFLKDPRLLLKWLKAIVLRISFWRTRSIFRFIKYLMLNFFQQSFNTLGVKGFKVRLKGKISAAGNSRKRSILYRVGQTSHSTLDLRVASEVDTIITFTGVMGLSVSIFY